jgi:serine/threonine protein kinase
MNATRPTELSPGGLLARGYRIVQKTGKGNMGCVYEAVQVSLDRDARLNKPSIMTKQSNLGLEMRQSCSAD